MNETTPISLFMSTFPLWERWSLGGGSELFSLLIDFIAAAPKYFPLKMSANLNGFSPKGKSTGKHFFPFDRKVNRTHLRDLWLY